MINCQLKGYNKSNVLLLAAGTTIQVQEAGGHHPLQTFSRSCGSLRLSMKTCMGSLYKQQHYIPSRFAQEYTFLQSIHGLLLFLMDL